MRASRLKYVACTCALMLLPAALAEPAAAEEPAKSPDSGNQPYWSVSFLGGLLTPRKEMRTWFDQSLLAGTRVGWTGRSGLGIEVTADYSPLPRDDVPELVEFETHFGVATAAPRFTLRWKKLRLWVGAGGGVAVERTTEFYRTEKVETSNDWSPAVVGSAGLDLHLLDSGGLTVVGSYARVFRELGVEGVKYEFANLTGGLVFVFQ